MTSVASLGPPNDANRANDPSSDTAAIPALSKPEIYLGTTPPVPQRNPAIIAESGGVTLNFVNADIREVVNTLLGETLKTNFVVDPRVQGVITMRTARAVPKAAVVAVLEDILAMYGAALEQTGELYKVVPIDEATQTPQILSLAGDPIHLERGFGLHVIPLQYASASALQDVLGQFAPQNRTLRFDHRRNLIIFVGTGGEARDVESLVASFDVDWMAGMSFGIFPVRVTDPKTIATELEGIFTSGGEASEVGVVRFVPIPRLSAVLVITAQASYLDRAREWVARLDRGEEGQTRKLYVYYVQNGRAPELAATLSQVFGLPSATTASSQALLAPGLSPTEIMRYPAAATSAGSVPPTVATGMSGDSAPESTAPAPTEGSTFGQRTQSETGGQGLDYSAPAEPAQDVGQRLRIVADARNNALVVYATPDEYQIIDAALQKLDIVPLQVLIEATVAEVTLNDTLKYGLQWFFHSGDHSFTLSSLATGVVASAFPGFSYVFASDDVRIVLNALKEVTDVKVISSPDLMVLDNENARLQVGDQVPIVVRSAVSVTDPDSPVVNEVDYRDTGVILDIIPRVNASGLVVLDIIQEVSDVTATTTSDIDSPTIQQRKIASTVAVNSGETIALGGLIRDRNENGTSGLPVLSDIPVLGNLFKTTSDIARRTELLVLLTPRVIRDRLDARQATLDLQKRLRALDPLSTRIQ